MSRLLCEGVAGGVDAVVLGALLAPDGPEVVPAISKANLGAGVRALRRVGRMQVAAIRDRDFDFDPEDGDEPVVWEWDREVVGWRWRRHELESYLVDPALVIAASLELAASLEAREYERILLAAARDIAAYQAARWMLGDVRRRLPRRLDARPAHFNKDFDLPEDLGADACLAWACKELDGHRATVPDSAALESRYRLFLDRFTSEAFGVDDALLWFSGKDLMAAVARRAQAEGLSLWSSAGGLRNMVRDWIRAHPDEALRRVPEWAKLKELVSV